MYTEHVSGPVEMLGAVRFAVAAISATVSPSDLTLETFEPVVITGSHPLTLVKYFTPNCEMCKELSVCASA